jgi:clan AA aspartic protease
MIGRVFGHQVLLNIRCRLTGNHAVEMEAVVDTGFTGFLALPSDTVEAIRLPYARSMYVNLADGSTIEVAVHTATISWNEEVRAVEVLSTGTRPLIGTLLLDGNELTVHFEDAGLVTLNRLQRLSTGGT